MDEKEFEGAPDELDGVDAVDDSEIEGLAYDEIPSESGDEQPRATRFPAGLFGATRFPADVLADAKAVEDA